VAVTPMTDTNGRGWRRTWRDALNAPYQASDDAVQVGWAWRILRVAGVGTELSPSMASGRSWQARKNDKAMPFHFSGSGGALPFPLPPAWQA
jgi:hypothetical protein